MDTPTDIRQAVEPRLRAGEAFESMEIAQVFGVEHVVVLAVLKELARAGVCRLEPQIARDRPPGDAVIAIGRRNPQPY